MKRAAFLSGAGAAGAALLARPADAASLNARVARIARDLPGRIGVYARTLAPDGQLAAYDASERFPTASVIKVLIMATAYAAQEARPGALYEHIVFRSGDLIGGSDYLSGARDGSRFTVAQLLVPMITVSDNTAANLLIDHFGLRAINALARRAGMHRTHLARPFAEYTSTPNHNENQSTPADMGRLLYLIAYGAHEGIPTIASAVHCRRMVQVMLHQTDRDGIPAALPRDVPVANKTGEVDGTRNDIAVVAPYGDTPFVLSIMSKDLGDYGAAYAAIHAVTRAVYRAR